MMGFFGVHPIELLIVGLLFCAGILFVVSKGLLVVVGLFKSVGSGQVTLACPHCGQQTPHTSGRCEACGRELQ